ncbi:MAG: 4Fe-4S binding protein [Clostridia bacterium]
MRKTCKFGAIEVVDNHAVIDYEKCKNCGMCAKVCPTGAIVNYRKKKKTSQESCRSQTGSGRGSACTGISLVIAFIKNGE